MTKKYFVIGKTMENQSFNPYQAPQSEVHISQEPDELIILDTPDSLPIGAGVSWIGESWRIFMARPLLWLGASFIFWAILMTAGAIPIIGNILMILLLAGMGYMAFLIENEQNMEIGDLFIAFKERTGNLVWLFFAQFLFLFILTIPTMALMFFVMSDGNGKLGNDDPISMLITILIGSLYLCICGAVAWFSHLLVFFHELPSFTAMKYSLKMTFKNLLPITLYGFIISIIWFLSILTFGLGFLVALPLTAISTYVAYRQMATYD